MNKTISREKLINQINNLIATSIKPEERKQLQDTFSFLLMKLDLYKGFSYADWIDNGYVRWIEAGRPDDKKPFFGDETKVIFY